MSINTEKENDEKLMIFVVVIDIQSKYKNLGSCRTGFLKISHEMISLLSVTPSTCGSMYSMYNIINNINISKLI